MTGVKRGSEGYAKVSEREAIFYVIPVKTGI